MVTEQHTFSKHITRLVV